MYYERIIGIDNDKCISLSEAFRNSQTSTADMREYLTKYRDMMTLLKQNMSMPLRKHPQFVWKGVDSACWLFEEHRIMHALRDMLVTDASVLFNQSNHKEARPMLEEALHLCKHMLVTNETWNKTPFVRAMAEFQPLYLLGLAFRTKSLYCENVCAFKTSPPVARLAFQFSELSDVCWKQRAEKDHTRQLLTAWHHSSAMASDETTDFTKRLSHITCARQLSEAPAVIADYESIMEKNRTVYFVTADPIKCDLLSLTQGMTKL
tara:strand:- start:716 stop:1504 length:789 start_codon:yes stop_codon:yes gene_type:complete